MSVGEIPVVTGMTIKTGMTNGCNKGKKDNNHNGLIALSPYRLNAFSKAAFTMAEILLSLTIIGVVAAITLPSLTGNINERTWNTQRKALYARMSQAISLMPALNGFGTVSGNVNTSSRIDTAAETFVASGLSKVLKINNICDAEHYADCGLPESINPMTGSNPITTSEVLTYQNYVMWAGAYGENMIGGLDTKAVALETQNGESILLYYRPKCKADLNDGDYFNQYDKVCVNMVYDLNGSKGPNTVGKDIGFITVFYPYDPVVVAPMPLSKDAGSATFSNAGALCLQQDSDSRVPNRDELTAMLVNEPLVKNSSQVNLWSSTVYEAGNPGTAWAAWIPPGDFVAIPRNETGTVRCVKR